MAYTLIALSDRPALLDTAAKWFHEKWGVPVDAYRESMRRCLEGADAVPQWYLALEGEEIVAGCGVIDNDFHPRKDLTPNVCAVYTQPDHRCRGLAGALLDLACHDMAHRGVRTLYLLTDHTGFYERYGWTYLCPVTGEGEERPSRMYMRQI